MFFSSAGTPTVWLEVDGHVLDNSFVHKEGTKPSPVIFRLRDAKLYSKDDFSTSKRKERLFSPRGGMDLELSTKLLR